MGKEQRSKGKYNFKKNFITGLMTVLPLYITYIFMSWVMNLLHKNLNFIPQKLFPKNYILVIIFELFLFSFIIFLIYIIGILTGNYIGKKLIQIGENFLKKIPLIRTIYSGTKQILDSFMMQNRKAFKQVVLVEYPRKGMWVFGFITGEFKIEEKHRKKRMIPVFIPSTPNPTTGFLILLPKKDIKKVNLTPDEAIKSIISGGVIAPKVKIYE